MWKKGNQLMGKLLKRLLRLQKTQHNIIGELMQVDMVCRLKGIKHVILNHLSVPTVYKVILCHKILLYPHEVLHPLL